jgi:MFS family permease
MGSAIILGMTFGSVTAGKLMVYGRRQALLIATIIGIIGVLITYKLNLYFLIAGRAIFGFACGIYAVV